MDGINIRQIDDFDLELVNTLCEMEIENLGPEAAVNEWVIPVIIRYGKVFIAEKSSGDKIIGVCEILRSYREPQVAFIHSLYIDRNFRGGEVGKYLLGEVLQKLREDDFKEVQLTVNPSNLPAVGLYRGFGFIKTETRKDEYGGGIHRDLFNLSL